jgi:cation diffusion facilitator CzcD-associated flavoprotein CzcO
MFDGSLGHWTNGNLVGQTFTYFLQSSRPIPIALRTIHVTHVALCTGLHVVPHIPSVPGVEYISQLHMEENPTVFHSYRYKSRSQLNGRRVMILGTGETGMDIAYEAVKAGAKEVVLCSRSGYVYPSDDVGGLNLPFAFRFLSFPKALVSW